MGGQNQCLVGIRPSRIYNQKQRQVKHDAVLSPHTLSESLTISESLLSIQSICITIDLVLFNDHSSLRFRDINYLFFISHCAGVTLANVNHLRMLFQHKR